MNNFYHPITIRLTFINHPSFFSLSLQPLVCSPSLSAFIYILSSASTILKGTSISTPLSFLFSSILLVCPLGYLYHPWFAVSLSPASHVNGITKETVARHPSTNNTSDHWTRVYTYPHLEEGEEERRRGKEEGREEKGRRGKGT